MGTGPFLSLKINFSQFVAHSRPVDTAFANFYIKARAQALLVLQFATVFLNVQLADAIAQHFNPVARLSPANVVANVEIDPNDRTL